MKKIILALIITVAWGVKAAKEFHKEIELMDELMITQRVKKYQGGFWTYME